MTTFIRSIENSLLCLAALGWVIAGLLVLSCTGPKRASTFVATTVSVPPFLDSIVFDLESASPGALAVQPPGEPEALPLGTLASGRLRSSPALTSLEVRRPSPGAWRFAGPGEAPKVRLRKGLSHLRGRLVEPPPGGIAGGHCQLVYEVVDVFGEPLSELAASSLVARAWLSAPGGPVESLTWHQEPGPPEAVRFVASRPQFCRRPGRYRLDVEVVSRDLVGLPTRLWRDAALGFTVPILR